jgi:hypothetical protein
MPRIIPGGCGNAIGPRLIRNARITLQAALCGLMIDRLEAQRTSGTMPVGSCREAILENSA